MVSMPMRDYSEIQLLKVNIRNFDIMREDIGIVTGIEKNPHAAVLHECGKSPVLLKSGRFAESIIDDGNAIRRLNIQRLFPF